MVGENLESSSQPNIKVENPIKTKVIEEDDLDESKDKQNKPEKTGIEVPPSIKSILDKLATKNNINYTAGEPSRADNEFRQSYFFNTSGGALFKINFNIVGTNPVDNKEMQRAALQLI